MSSDYLIQKNRTDYYYINLVQTNIIANKPAVSLLINQNVWKKIYAITYIQTNICYFCQPLSFYTKPNY